MPADLSALNARLAALDAPAGFWPGAVEDLLDTATDPATTPFADTALLDAGPGAGTVLVVGADGRVDQSTLPEGFNGIRTFSVTKVRTGSGTRIGKPILKAQVRGDHCYFTLELQMRHAPSGGGPNPDTPADNEDADL